MSADLKDDAPKSAGIPDLIRKLYVAQEGRCSLCGAPMAMKQHRSGDKKDLGWTEEHVMAKSIGGARAGNILLAHSICNNKKGNRPPSAEEVAFLVATYMKIARIK
jgi:5-methylcytosine-specific restriction endonuclease McrA